MRHAYIYEKYKKHKNTTTGRALKEVLKVYIKNKRGSEAVTRILRSRLRTFGRRKKRALSSFIRKWCRANRPFRGHGKFITRPPERSLPSVTPIRQLYQRQKQLIKR